MRRTGRRGSEVVHVEIRPRVWRALPAWMTDASVCAAMSLGPPQLSIAALNELRAVLSDGSTLPSVGESSDKTKKEKSDETTVKDKPRPVEAVSLSRTTSTVRRVKERGIAERPGGYIARGPQRRTKRKRRKGGEE